MDDQGTFIAKFFKNSHTYFLLSQLMHIFEKVESYKPSSSRESSSESFLICRKIRPDCVLRMEKDKSIKCCQDTEPIKKFFNYIRNGDLTYFMDHNNLASSF